MVEQLPLRLKPFVPDGVVEFQELLEGEQISFQSVLHCLTRYCGQEIILNDLSIEWPVDNMRFYYLGPIPGYRCGRCQITYVPGGIFERARSLIQNDINSMGRSETFELPRNIKPLG